MRMSWLFGIILALVIVACENRVHQQNCADERFVTAMIDSSKELSDSDLKGYELVSLKYGKSELTEWKIVDGDTLILVSTLQPREWEYANLAIGDSITTSSSVDNVMWVTIPKELNDKLLSEKYIADSTQLNTRLQELIGLRPDDENSTLNLFWIDKNNLLRPSYNPDPTTSHGAIKYPQTVTPEWYQEWFEGNIEYSYEAPNQGLNYPFTRLGYTYDWGVERSKYGLSEFITVPSSEMILESKSGCWSYYKGLF